MSVRSLVARIGAQTRCTDFLDELEPVGQDLVRDGEDVGRLLGRLRGWGNHEERGRKQGLVVQSEERRKREEGRRGAWWRKMLDGGQGLESIRVGCRLESNILS